MKKYLTSHKLTILFLLLTVIISGILYKDSFGAYFFQDDWFTFKISKVSSLSGFLNFFVPRTDVIYYRPLGMQIPFFIMQNLFGLNPLPYHLLIFLTHTVNIVLVFILIRLLSRKNLSALLAAFLYGTSTVHYIPFYWFATYAFILGPTAFFGSAVLFLQFFKNHKKKYYFFSIVVFILGMFINEMVAVLPVVLMTILLLKKDGERILSLWPYVFFVTIIFTYRFIIFPPPLSGTYKISLGKYVLNNLEAYFLWSQNWPEEMKAQLINFITVNPQFIKDFWLYSLIFFVTLFSNLSLVFALPIFMSIGKMLEIPYRKIILGSCWFMVGLLPVVFFPDHVFSYYLPISLVGLLLIIVTFLQVLTKNLKLPFRVLIYTLVGVNWLIASFATMDFNSKVHWAPRRAAIANNLTKEMQAIKRTSLGKKNIFYISDFSENKLALNDQDGLQVLFDNPEIEIIYGNGEGKNSL